MKKEGLFLVLRFLLWMAVTAYIAVGIWYWREMSVTGNVYRGLDVRVQDDQKFVDGAAVGSWLDSFTGGMEGKPVELLPLYGMEDRLRSEAYVQNVEVFSDMSGHCVVELSQRDVIVRVVSDKGHDFFMDTLGYRLNPKGVWQKDVPVITTDQKLPFGPGDYGGNCDGYADTMRYYLENLRNFVKVLNEDEFLVNFVTQVKVGGRIRPGKECLYLIPRVGTQRMVFGNFADTEEKLSNMSLFCRKTFKDGWYQDASQVCFQYGNKVVIKRN